MKLNHECIRDILLSVETMKYGEQWTINHLVQLLPQYSEEELQYHCMKLYEEGYLDALTVNMARCPEQIARIIDLKMEGHKFLEDIRSDTAWNRTKDIAKSVGSFSINSLKEIASNVVSQAIKSHFGI